MAVVILLFGVVNVWWYVGYYRFYQLFAQGHEPRMIYVSDFEGNVIESRVESANEYVWEDETYRYRVLLPDYLQTYDRLRYSCRITCRSGGRLI